MIFLAEYLNLWDEILDHNMRETHLCMRCLIRSPNDSKIEWNILSNNCPRNCVYGRERRLQFLK